MIAIILAHHAKLLVFTVVAAIIAYNSCRNRTKLTRKAILLPNLSPWPHLYCFGDDGSFLEITGFDRVTFNRLLATLFDEENEDTERGRPS
jgi:hypothetical protein